MLERYIILAEITYKSGETHSAMAHAKKALAHTTTNTCPTAIALRIFIARCNTKLGRIRESNTIYRQLLRENIYMPPVIMGLLYNNFKTRPTDKMRMNTKLIKVLIK